jgi:hypothetical protein
LLLVARAFADPALFEVAPALADAALFGVAPALADAALFEVAPALADAPRPCDFFFAGVRAAAFLEAFLPALFLVVRRAAPVRAALLLLVFFAFFAGAFFAVARFFDAFAFFLAAMSRPFEP